MSYFDQYYLLQHGFFKFFVKKKGSVKKSDENV